MSIMKEAKKRMLSYPPVQSSKEDSNSYRFSLIVEKSKQRLKNETDFRLRILKIQTDILTTRLSLKSPNKEEIAPRKSNHLLKLELGKIEAEHFLFSHKEYSVYCVPGCKIPHLLYEIGRLREITFREVGEGTNKSIDLDEYDQYYHQLLIWDTKEELIVGGYRIGLGHEIMANKGRKGFYTQTLFRLKNQTESLLEEAMEMGRSFVVSQYQRKPHSLFLLWKGILFFLLNKPQYRYLIGPVSISENFSALTQQLIVEFVQQKYYDADFAKKISARTSFNKTVSKKQVANLLQQVQSLQELDNLIFSLEKKRLPVLLRKYLQLGGKIASFNVDPLFNNSLDCFLILDLNTLPQDIMLSLSKDIDNNVVKKRFVS